MKKGVSILLIVLLIFLSAFGIFSCKDDPEPVFVRTIFAGNFKDRNSALQFDFTDDPVGLRVKVNDSKHGVSDMGYAFVQNLNFSVAKTLPDYSVALLTVKKWNGWLYFTYGITYADKTKNFTIQGILDLRE